MKQSSALVVALGDVRDGVAAVEAFAQALASRRVGPRVLAAGVPALAAGCGPLRVAIDGLGEAVAQKLADDPDGRDAMREMLAHAALRVGELEQALEGREKAPIDARERLAIEAVVRRAASELDAVVRLTDLFVAATAPQSTWMNLAEVLAERRPSHRPAHTPVLAIVELATPMVVVHDPRLLLELFELAVATVVRAGVEAPRIVATRDADDLLVVTVEANPGGPPSIAGGKRRPAQSVNDGSSPHTPAAPSRVLDVSLRPELPREADVVRAIARRAGFELVVAPDARTVTLLQLPGAATLGRRDAPVLRGTST